MCPNAGDSDTQTSLWTSIFGAPIAERLNAQAPGANLVASDISALIPLCAFETIAKLELSPFCYLFTKEEFAEYEYYGDLDKYYGTGCVRGGQPDSGSVSFLTPFQIWSTARARPRRRIHQRTPRSLDWPACPR